MGVLEHNGDIITEVVPDRKKATLHPIIKENVKPHSEIHTDDFLSYVGIGGQNGYWHKTVNHSADQYVSPTGTTVNSLESF